MARIKEKTTQTKKESLGNIIWTWTVVGVLSAVVITGIVLAIIYFVNLNKGDDTEKTFEDQYSSEYHITYEELDNILLDENTNFDLSNGMYVFIYSPNYEEWPNKVITYNNEEIKLSEFIEKVIEANPSNFRVLNILNEENTEYSVQDQTVASLNKYPTLLMIGMSANNGYDIIVPEEFGEDYESGVVTKTGDIVNILERVKNN